MSAEPHPSLRFAVTAPYYRMRTPVYRPRHLFDCLTDREVGTDGRISIYSLYCEGAGIKKPTVPCFTTKTTRAL